MSRLIPKTQHNIICAVQLVVTANMLSTWDISYRLDMKNQDIKD